MKQNSTPYLEEAETLGEFGVIGDLTESRKCTLA
jgi:hypothetical protein